MACPGRETIRLFRRKDRGGAHTGRVVRSSIFGWLAAKAYGALPRHEKLQLVPGEKAVSLAEHRAAVRLAGFHHRHHIALGKIAGVGRVLPRLAEVKARGIGPVADLVYLPRPDRIEGLARGGGVHRVPVGVRDRRRVIRGLGAALQLEARDPGLQQRRNVLDHAHIPGVEDICPAVLRYFKILPGAFFLHQMIFPPAGLGAAALIRVPPGQIIRQQAPPGKRHAHRPVAEGLQIQRRRGVLAQRGDLIEGHLPGQDDPRRAEVVKHAGRLAAQNARLGADMYGEAGRVSPAQVHHPEIGDDGRVRPGVVKKRQIFRQRRHLPVVRDGVAGHVHPHAPGVAVFDGAKQLVGAEIPGGGAHSVGLTRQIDGVRSVGDGHDQFFHIPRGGQYLGFRHAAHSCYFADSIIAQPPADSKRTRRGSQNRRRARLSCDIYFPRRSLCVPVRVSVSTSTSSS